MATELKGNTTSEVLRSEFMKNELAKLGYGSSYQMATQLTNAGDLLDAALDEELEPAMLDALVWAVKNH